MKPEWWTNGKACSRIPRVIEIWREQGCEVTPLYSGAALLDAHQRGRREGRAEGKCEGLREAAEVAEHEIVSVYDDGPETESEFNDLARAIADAIRAKAQEVTE